MVALAVVVVVIDDIRVYCDRLMESNTTTTTHLTHVGGVLGQVVGADAIDGVGGRVVRRLDHRGLVANDRVAVVVRQRRLLLLLEVLRHLLDVDHRLRHLFLLLLLWEKLLIFRFLEQLSTKASSGDTYEPLLKLRPQQRSVARVASIVDVGRCSSVADKNVMITYLGPLRRPTGGAVDILILQAGR